MEAAKNLLIGMLAGVGAGYLAAALYPSMYLLCGVASVVSFAVVSHLRGLTETTTEEGGE